jgi:RNA polymerase sigma factor (sigma-70 family)
MAFLIAKDVDPRFSISALEAGMDESEFGLWVKFIPLRQQFFQWCSRRPPECLPSIKQVYKEWLDEGLKSTAGIKPSEVDLLDKYYTARDQLFKKYIAEEKVRPLAHYLASKFKRMDVPEEILFNSIGEGLFMAIERYDPRFFYHLIRLMYKHIISLAEVKQSPVKLASDPRNFIACFDIGRTVDMEINEFSLCLKAKNGNKDALRVLHSSYVPRMKAWAKWFHEQIPQVSITNLDQETELGFSQAITTYHPGLAINIFNYWIRNSVFSSPEIEHLTRTQLKHIKDVRKVHDQLLQTLERMPTVYEIANVLHKKVEEIEEILQIESMYYSVTGDNSGAEDDTDQDDLNGDNEYGSAENDGIGIHPEKSLLRQEWVRTLDTALDELDAENARIVRMRIWNGLSHQEIADKLQLSNGAVRVRIYESLKKIKVFIKREVLDWVRNSPQALSIEYIALAWDLEIDFVCSILKEKVLDVLKSSPQALSIKALATICNLDMEIIRSILKEKVLDVLKNSPQTLSIEALATNCNLDMEIIRSILQEPDMAPYRARIIDPGGKQDEPGHNKPFPEG